VSKPRAQREPTSRLGRRVHSIGAVDVKYEGFDEPVVTRLPDVSTGGMFINTVRSFPEGAVLDLRFRLENTGADVQTRGEVRYCVPGVGVGVEFVGAADTVTNAILAEIESADRAKVAKYKSPRKKKLLLKP
jgi:PilZ domain